MALGALVRSRRYLLVKTANFLLVWIQKRIFKPARVIGYPYYLTVDPGNICDMRCPLCPTGQRKEGRARGFLRLDDFRKLIDRLAPYIIVLDLFNWGEPFLNRDTFEMISYARSKGMVVRVSSNLNCLRDGSAARLAGSECDLLLVSLFGASQETAERYQEGTDFAHVVENMRAVRKARKRFPVVTWRFLVNKYNEHEIPKAVETMKGTADAVEFNHLFCDMGEEPFWDNRTQYENIRPWLPDDGHWSHYDGESAMKKRTRTRSCSFLYSSCYVNWNGSVSPCCMVWPEKYDFGNVFREEFEAVWNNELFRASRGLIFKGRPSAVRTICGICRKNKALR
ncbi:MAG: radical SAM protein [Spirochaetales bacterium]|nr:radical SAM protein [Spirochaetales bacterium]